MIGEDRLIHFSGVALGEACTIVLRGARSIKLAIFKVKWPDFYLLSSVFFPVSFPVLMSLMKQRGPSTMPSVF